MWLQFLYNKKNVERYLEYLKIDDAQNIYASYGFVKAAKEDMKNRN